MSLTYKNHGEEFHGFECIYNDFSSLVDSIDGVADTDNLYLESAPGRGLTLWRIDDMEAVAEYFKRFYPAGGNKPILRKIKFV